MENNHSILVRRTRAEWRRLVNQWRRSGSTARVFAEKHDVEPHTLSWWKWHLKSKPPPAARARPKGDLVRLMRVDVAETPATRDDIAWELTSASGERLRVRGSIAPADLRAVLSALTGKRSSR
jgi:hypothetical protein